MGKYGQVAIKAARYIEKGYEPRQAWEVASCETFEKGSASQSKGCPKAAFLGLYGGSGKNAEYSRAALGYLKSNPKIEITPNELWTIIMMGNQKVHNQQMDVVLSLFKEGLV